MILLDFNCQISDLCDDGGRGPSHFWWQTSNLSTHSFCSTYFHLVLSGRGVEWLSSFSLWTCVFFVVYTVCRHQKSCEHTDKKLRHIPYGITIPHIHHPHFPPVIWSSWCDSDPMTPWPHDPMEFGSPNGSPLTRQGLGAPVSSSVKAERMERMDGSHWDGTMGGLPWLEWYGDVKDWS